MSTKQNPISDILEMGDSHVSTRQSFTEVQNSDSAPKSPKRGIQDPINDTLELQEEGDSQHVSTRQSFKEVQNSDRALKPKRGTQILVALLILLASMITNYLNTHILLLCIINTNNTKEDANSTNIANFEITMQMDTWIREYMIIIPLSAFFGGIAGGPCIEYLGRRYTILATTLPYIGSFILIVLTQDATVLLVGPALCGFSMGIISLSLSVYLCETMQTKLRGRLGTLPNTFGNYGTIICVILDIFLAREKMLLLSASLLIFLIFILSLTPETPGWYISKGKTAQSQKILQTLRGTDTDITDELTMIEKLFIENERNVSHNTISKLLKRNNLKPLLVSLGLMWFQQMSGTYVVQFYMWEFIDITSTSLSMFRFVYSISHFIFTRYIDKGRKKLLYISSVLMALSLFSFGGLLYAIPKDVDGSLKFLLGINLIVYMIGYLIGFGPIPWLIMGEILPAKTRSSTASIVTSFNWMCNFIVAKTFKNVVAVIGKPGIFWLFGVFVVVGFIFVIISVPETSGKSPKEIEESFKKNE
ncbi:facilitated trehalose transporter Tret1-like isoform X2 [Odontomachus brunneus]|uniref:facilitated trehalose transporter Tret1-like isoform X2 n=1 Tax=Odontomachus brunneus TaxID=486640 RepID=UPI0013F1BBC3|nr:facilitated trehalose transporter Tret1-like isoform X2 [Odontomachus brunneus]